MTSNKTACFSGYRPGKFSFILLDGQEAYLNLESRIQAEIIKAMDNGYDTFLCGMAMGFDLVCGSNVLRLKQNHPECSKLRLIAVPPYHGHRFDGPWGVIHSLVMNNADEGLYPTPRGISEKNPFLRLSLRVYLKHLRKPRGGRPCRLQNPLPF